MSGDLMMRMRGAQEELHKWRMEAAADLQRMSDTTRELANGMRVSVMMPLDAELVARYQVLNLSIKGKMLRVSECLRDAQRMAGKMGKTQGGSDA